LLKYGVTAKSVEIWGSGKPKREFLWSEDMADACVHIMQHVDFKNLTASSHLKGDPCFGEEIRNTHINIGTGVDLSIKELAEKIKNIVGFSGELVFNSEKPDGTLRKVTDIRKISNLGWKPSVMLDEGIRKMYDWYLQK